MVPATPPSPNSVLELFADLTGPPSTLVNQIVGDSKRFFQAIYILKPFFSRLIPIGLLDLR